MSFCNWNCRKSILILLLPGLPSRFEYRNLQSLIHRNRRRGWWWGEYGIQRWSEPIYFHGMGWTMLKGISSCVQLLWEKGRNIYSYTPRMENAILGYTYVGTRMWDVCDECPSLHIDGRHWMRAYLHLMYSMTMIILFADYTNLEIYPLAFHRFELFPENGMSRV